MSGVFIPPSELMTQRLEEARRSRTKRFLTFKHPGPMLSDGRANGKFIIDSPLAIRNAREAQA